MLRLNNMTAQPGATHSRRRKGRGHATGLGPTGGKGDKGQNARKSGNVRPGFEGGQMPLYRRLPKVGFKNVMFQRKTSILNVSDLERLDPKAFGEISLKSLKEHSLAKSATEKLSILGNGELTKAFSIKAHKVSKSALEKITKAGGKVEIVPPPAKPVKNKMRKRETLY